MRIPPNTHPVIRIRNTVVTIAALLTIWSVLNLAACARQLVEPAQAALPPGG